MSERVNSLKFCTWKVCILGGVLMFASACAQKPARQSTEHLLAQQRLQSGQSSLAKRQWKKAGQQFAEALKVYDGLYDTDGRTQAVLGLSRALAESGKADEALVLINQALDLPERLTPQQKVQLHGRQAGLYLNKGDTAMATTAWAQAQTVCANTCSELMALDVLQARIALATKDGQLALDASQRAISRHVRVALPDVLNQSVLATEQANALRTQAQAHLLLQAHELALTAAHSALQIDQRLGLSNRVAMDLQVLADIHTRAGHSTRAVQFAQDAARARGESIPAAAPR